MKRGAHPRVGALFVVSLVAQVVVSSLPRKVSAQEDTGRRIEELERRVQDQQKEIDGLKAKKPAAPDEKGSNCSCGSSG